MDKGREGPWEQGVATLGVCYLWHRVRVGHCRSPGRLLLWKPTLLAGVCLPAPDQAQSGG
jgi:hypothetical protein